MMKRPTTTDPISEESVLHDHLVRLREWGTDRSHPLPTSDAECTIGAAEACALRLPDGSAGVSRLHARLVRTEDRWSIEDLGSKNGVWIDGARCDAYALAPGVEIRLGKITLIAESPRSIAVRGFLARLLGWRADRARTVDHALGALRRAAARRTALLLSGPEDLVPIARALHRRALPPGRPFIVCDPRRARSRGTARAPANLDRAVPAVGAAAGGSLCVRGERPPRDLADALPLLRRPDAGVQLVVCARRPAKSDLYAGAAISVPPLGKRKGELGWIIAEYAGDAILQLGAPRDSFTARDRAWVRDHAASSLAEIEKATLRIVAVRISDSSHQAARRLGMSRAALSSWLERKRPP